MGSKSGFFNLFDWNSKSRKKLFSDEGSKQGKKNDESLPTTRRSLIDEDETVIHKWDSDYGFASPSVDDESVVVRAPNVVARLMGLECLPTTSVSDPYLSPSYESHSREANHQKRMLDPQITGFAIPSKFDGFSWQPIETRKQMTPSSPIEKFKMEALPPKSTKSLPLTHHKLLSPIRNPNGFRTAKNATHIMEAAAKIIEPGLHGVGMKSRRPLLCSSSIPLKVRDPKECFVLKREPKIVETSRRPVEFNAARSLRGQALNKSWNGSDDSGDFRGSPDSGIRSSSGVKGKGKSISLAVQAKVNVQRREAMGSSRRSISEQEDQEESEPYKHLACHVNAQKNNRQKKTSTSGASGVLRQNNQRQNCPSNREKLSSKATGSSQKGKKVLSGDASRGRSKTFSRLSGNHASEMADEKDVMLSRTKNVPRKKRMIKGEFQSERSRTNVWVDGREELVQSNIVIDEHVKLAEDNGKKETDVVSFTFTSPRGKSPLAPRTSVVLLEKLDAPNGCNLDALNEKKSADLKHKKASSHGRNVTGGDALSILLDRKLRELVCGVDMSHCDLVKMGSITTTTSFILDAGFMSDSNSLPEEKHVKNFLPANHDEKAGNASITTTTSFILDAGFMSDSNSLPEEKHVKNFLPANHDEKAGDASDSMCSSTNGLVLKVKNKHWESQGTTDCKDLDNQNTSPLSILEASFSSESCNSSESWDNNTNENTVGLMRSLAEAELELSDSASSAHKEIPHGECVVGTDDQKLDYMKELLSNLGLSLNNIFEHMEKKRIRCGERIRREVLLDCARECLDLKCSQYFNGGYKTWAKGVAVVGNEVLLAEELYKEVSQLTTMGDWMVDELVDNDMSSHLGRWMDFETESFEAGVEIERGLFSWLIDEVVADILV
ncbi:hypothetical protein QJS10_CPB04g00941 [Acorus calamus]|uniref:DUF4378 domain-containing protein n=1 Tax=Acorus calamus TaxID=4465 RepID=A0AAV9F4A5_ACOCL|nr:hypothetical protein QJS10_CPB04g00941 [Acorus calamus]